MLFFIEKKTYLSNIGSSLYFLPKNSFVRYENQDETKWKCSLPAFKSFVKNSFELLKTISLRTIAEITMHMKQ